MEINLTIDSLNSNEIIQKRQNVKFHSFEFDKYREMFEDLALKNYIEGKFDDVQWKLPCNISDYLVNINFDIEVYHNLNLALKAYSIVRLMGGRTAITIYNEVNLLKKTILASDGFKDLIALEGLLETQNKLYSYQGHQMSIDLKRFVSFYNIELQEEVITICDNHQNLQRKQRKLPAFDDIMQFDDIINDYFRTYPIEETLEFLPIMLWWTITNIIPMRPSELLLLEKNCLRYYDNHHSPYRIMIPRIKNEADSPEQITHYDQIEIDSKTYSLVDAAIQQLNSIQSHSKYLFTVELLFTFRKTKRKKRNKRINRRDFDLLKKDFYEKVVDGIYGISDLERIKSGDTRHFAIINMALQGFNMLSIARMAGHDEIRSQHSYYSHAEHFSQSYVYRMAQQRLEYNISSKMNNSMIGWKRYIFDKGKIHNIKDFDLNHIVGRIEFGFCTEMKSTFPSTCIEFCKYCPMFIFDPAVNEETEAIKWLTDSSEYLEKEIRESIELMKDLSSSLSKSYSQGNDDLLKSTSRKLMSYMDMKATIDCNLMGVEMLVKKQ